MGTWDAGPFGNDAALDYLGSVVGGLEQTIEEFVADPQIDETFDPAFAAVAALNLLVEHTPACLRDPGVVRGWRDAMLRCYDQQIDNMEPQGDFKNKQREALLRELDRLVAIAERQAAADSTTQH